MKRFFDPEGLLWKPLGFIGELVMLSLLWGVCSIALVTVGPATAALYDSVVHALRRRDDNLFSRFFRTFRAELKTGCLSALLWLGLLALLFFSWRFLTGLDDPRFGMIAWVVEAGVDAAVDRVHAVFQPEFHAAIQLRADPFPAFDHFASVHPKTLLSDPTACRQAIGRVLMSLYYQS